MYYSTCTCVHWCTDLLELSLTDSISVEDDSMRFEPRALVKVDKHLPDHGSQLSNNLLAMVLHSHRGRVAAGG